MKKILSIFLVALLLIGMLPMNALHTHAATAKYVKVTENLADWSGRYLIVYESGKKAMNGGLALGKIDADNNTINVTINNNAIEATSTVTAAEFTIASDGAGKYTIKSSANGYYIGRTSTSNGMDENASTAHKHTISYNGSNVVITSSGGPALQAYQSGSTYRFRYYKTTQKAIALYKLEESCSHANTTTSTTPATCTEDGKTVVTCKDCGEKVSETVIQALGHNYVGGACQNCGDELYTVSFSVPSQVAAVDSETADENTGKVTLPKADDYTGKYAYTFAGWATASVSETDQVPTLYAAGSQYTPNGNTTLYAVYTRTEGSGGAQEYVQTDASGIKPGDTVVITTTKNGTDFYAMSNNKGTGSAPVATKVTVSNGKLAASNDLTNLKWDIAGSKDAYIFYVSGSESSWLYCTGTNNGVRVGANTTNTFKIDASSGYLVHNGTSRYIGIYNNADWRCYTSVNSNITGQTLYFFVLSAGGMTYYTSILEDEDTTCKHTNTTETTVDATCTDAGKTTVTCDDCGATVSVTEIPAKGHTEVIDQAVAPTCVKTGLTEGKHCSVCNAVIVAQQTVPATGEHTFSGGVCTVCGEKKTSTAWQLVTDVDEILAGGQFVVVGTDGSTHYALPTAISGKMVGVVVTVADNKVVYVEGTTPVWTVESCGSGIALYNGSSYLKYGSSTNLSSSTTAYEFTLTAVGDAFKVVSTVDSNRGLVFRGKTYNQFGGYAMSNVPGTSAEYFGIQFYKLVNVCSHDTVVDVEAIPATCTSVGYTAGKQCTDCGAYTEGHEEVAMIDHSYEGKITTAPGCTTTGEKTYTCSACGNSYTEKVEAAGHTMGNAVIVEATCTEKGSKTYTCTVCGTETVETVPATGHSWSNWTQTTAPTCTEAGEETRSCVTCGATETQTVPAEGHKYDANGVCTVCGAEISYFQLVNDYTNILSGGEYIIAARIGDTFYALDTAADNRMGSKEVKISGTGTEMKVIYADGLPIWNVSYYAGTNPCVTLYNSVTGEYLTGGSSTSLGTSSDAWAWTFCDTDNASAGEDGEYAVVQSNGSVADGASAYVLVSNSVSADRAISFVSGKGFLNYSIRTSGFNRELYFFKLVEAGATEYSVTFKENGTQTMTQAVPVEENVIELPESTGAAMPEGYTNFVGWVTLPCAESLIAPTTIYKPGTTAAITEDTTFYALYTREDADAEGQAMSYHRVTDISQVQVGQKYIIVGLDTNGNYWAMSADQLSDDRGASAVTPDENGVITFLPEDKVAVFELSQGFDVGSYAFLDLNMNQFLYCSSSNANASLKSQGTLNSAASFVIKVVYDETTGHYSTMMANVSVERNYLMFNTIEQNNKLFSCYKLHADTDAEGNLEQNTFLYVGVSNTVNATYYATGLCDHNWELKEHYEANCENAGYSLYNCTVCGEIKLEDVVAHGHNLGEATVIDPTCTEAGSSTSVCLNADCGKEWVEVIPALGHTEVTDAAVAATCTTTGLTEGKHCSVCNTVLAPQQEIAALGHNEVTDAAVEPDCVNTGLTEGSHCDRCGEILNAQVEVPALGHKYTGAVAVNENNVPILTHTCSVCGDSYSIALRFSAADLKLQNSLIIGFRTNTDIAGEDGFTNIRATFQYGNRELMTVNLADTDLIDGKYQFLCRYITPSQIGDTVYATLYGTYNGVEYSFQMEYGVSQYCYNMLANEESTQELKNLMVDMLYYCDAARVYTNYKADESVTTKLTEEQKGYTTADREYTSVLNAKYNVIENPSASWKAASLVMYHSTRMQLRFALAEGVDISSVTAKVQVGTEEKTGYIAEDSDHPGQYRVIIDDIAARQMSDVVYITLYVGDTAISNTITYSVESYACAKKNDPNAKLNNLVKALMHYGDSAKAYLN